MGQWTEEELAGMSDAEREALLDEEGTDEPTDEEMDDDGADDSADDRSAGDDDEGGDDDDADEEEGDEEESDDDEPDEDESAEESDDGDKGDKGDEGADTAEEPEGEPESEQPDLPPVTTEVPENAEQRVAQIESDLKVLQTQFHDGEIDVEDYEAQRMALADERSDIRMAIKMREAEERGRHQAELNNQIKHFNSLKADAFKSNPIYQDKRGQQLFQEAVGIVAQTNPNEMDGTKFFQMVDRIARGNAMADGWGLEVIQSQQSRDSQQDAESQSGNQRRRGRKPARDRANVPPNIGDAPAAEQSETGGGEFAHLEKLSGMELEQALAKLSPEQQERYLRES